jgi:hypothetical protein
MRFGFSMRIPRHQILVVQPMIERDGIQRIALFDEVHVLAGNGCRWLGSRTAFIQRRWRDAGTTGENE